MLKITIHSSSNAIPIHYSNPFAIIPEKYRPTDGIHVMSRIMYNANMSSEAMEDFTIETNGKIFVANYTTPAATTSCYLVSMYCVYKL